MTQQSINNKVEKDDVKEQPSKDKVESPKFPHYSLSKVLKIAESIEKNNAGKPYDRLDLAKSLDFSPSSSTFRMMIIASTRYDLTKGNYNADKIELTSIGSSIVAPITDEQKSNGLRNALLNPPLFKDVYTYFDKKQIPREELFKNTLKKEFKVDSEDIDACYKVIFENMQDFGLLQDIKGNMYLQLDKLAVFSPQIIERDEDVADDETIIEDVRLPDKQRPEPPKPQEQQIPRVFISHSKNQNILDQLETILEFGKFEYIIAEDVETAAIPIPDKIFGLMRQCNCAIINISADEELRQEDGTYRINENVLIEIGAAFVHYDKRVILLVDKRLLLPSNLQGLYRCEYEGTELSFVIAMKLQKALTEFREKI